MDVYGSRDYNKAFDNVNQKEVDHELTKRFEYANSNKLNVIVDMTHMTSKRRRIHLNYFTNDYYKVGVIFPILTEDEYIQRNVKRLGEENKNISMSIIKRMLSSYQTIREDEGFNKIISL